MSGRVGLGPVAVAQLERRDEQLRAGAGCWPPTTWTASSSAGYSLTLTGGRCLWCAVQGDVAPGQEIVTRLADGTVRSTVDRWRDGQGRRARVGDRVDRVERATGTDEERRAA